MRSSRSKYKQMRHFAATLTVGVMVSAMLSACAPAPTRKAPVQAQAAPEALPLPQLEVQTPDAGQDLLAQLLVGQFALDHADLDKAAHNYIRASALSGDPKVAKLAAQLAIAIHDTDAAKKAIQRWIDLGGQGTDLMQVRARLALDTGDTDTARTQLLALVQSGDKDAWRHFGRLLMDARDAAQAGQLLKGIATAERLPSDPQAWLAMSELASKLGQVSYARKLASTAVNKFACADCYAWASQLQYQAGHREQARKLYAKAVAKAPDNRRLRLGYAAMLAQAGDNATAAQVLAKGTQDAETFRLRAANAARAKNKAELRRIYDQLQHASPEIREQSPYLLGQVAEVLEHTQQALDWFAQVPQDSKYRFDADVHSVFLWQRAGDMDKAHALARQMQADYATDPDKLGQAQLLDAELYMHAQQYAKAASAYTQALQSAPGNTDMLYARGIAYAESGQIDAAVADLQAVLEAKPGDINAANALGFTLADANRDLDQARKLIEHAHQARPEDPAITDSWGWLQYRLGHLDKAVEALQKAWKAGNDPQVGGHLAEVLWKQGRHDRARQVLAAARKLAPDDSALRALQAKIAP